MTKNSKEYQTSLRRQHDRERKRLVICKSNKSFKLKPMKITEKDVMNAICKYLFSNGFLVKRLPPSIYSAKGMPDLYFLKKGVGGFIEVKGEKGKQSPSQMEFEAQIKLHGGIYILANSIFDVKNYIIDYQKREKKELIK